MTPDDVRAAAAEQLVEFHERFAPLFGKEQAQDHAYDYLKGLMVGPERKSIEPIALTVGQGDVSGLQKFINSAPWAYDEVHGGSTGASRRSGSRSGVSSCANLCTAAGSGTWNCVRGPYHSKGGRPLRRTEAGLCHFD